MKHELTFSQIKKLCKALDCKPRELDFDNLLIYDDSEADQACLDYIRETLWAFNPSFLACHSKCGQEVFEAIKSNGKCESNNEAIMSCINDFNELVQDAIAWDGRGHFLAGYDGEEIELGGDLYAYRIN